MVSDEGWKLAGWAVKPFAILLSSFREVIFIDADSLFFKNPEVLFADPEYQETGALFFHDRITQPRSRKQWLQDIMPKPIPKMAMESRFWTGISGHMQESGVVVVRPIWTIKTVDERHGLADTFLGGQMEAFCSHATCMPP